MGKRVYKKSGGDLKRLIVLILIFCGALVCRGDAAEEAGVSPEAERILNLWCEFRVMRDHSFHLDKEVQKVVDGKEARVFHPWDLLVKHAGLAQKDKKNPPQVKFGALYVLSESRRRAATYLVRMASRQMIPILGKIQKERDAGLRDNAGYKDRFRSVLAVLNIAREMMNAGQGLLDQSPDAEDFRRLKKCMTEEIDLYGDVVAAHVDRVYTWGSPRDDPEKKKEAEERLAAVQGKYEAGIARIRGEVLKERLGLLEKYGLGRSRLAHGGNLLDRYAAKLIKSEKQYEEKYS